MFRSVLCLNVLAEAIVITIVIIIIIITIIITIIIIILFSFLKNYHLLYTAPISTSSLFLNVLRGFSLLGS